MPNGVGVACTDPKGPSLALFPQEKPAVANARPARLSEFGAGRMAAREAMRLIGQRPMPVPMAKNRAPVWPQGLVGSIAHDDQLCLALVAKTETCRSLAVDIEPDTDLPREIWSEVCTRRELEWLTDHPEHDRGQLAKRIFSAKECAYKCQFPLTGEMLGFHDFDILLTADGASFTARFQRSVGRFASGARLEGHCLSLSGHIVSLMMLEPARDEAAQSKIEIGAWT